MRKKLAILAALVIILILVSPILVLVIGLALIPVAFYYLYRRVAAVEAAVATPTENKMFCHQCGAQISLDSKFCNKCGTKQS